MQTGKYYDGSKLISMLDANGEVPEIFICCTNRTAGKTFYFQRWMLRRAIEKGEIFCLVYRHAGDLDQQVCQQLDVVMSNCFPSYAIREKFLVPKVIKEIQVATSEDIEHNLEDPKLVYWRTIAYAVALNKVAKIKECSHIMSKVVRMFFHEFQECNNSYLPDEVGKLYDVHTSIARGYGEQVRYVPVYMCGNHISVLNPYYLALGISHRLQSDTRYMKGNGWVLETSVYESAKEAQLSSGFNKAFASTSRAMSSAEGIYLNDTYNFVEESELIGSRDLFNIVYDGKYYVMSYGMYPPMQSNIMYLKQARGKGCKICKAVRHKDHTNETTLMQGSREMQYIKQYYNQGRIKFKDIMCKQVIYECLNIEMFG